MSFSLTLIERLSYNVIYDRIVNTLIIGWGIRQGVRPVVEQVGAEGRPVERASLVRTPSYCFGVFLFSICLSIEGCSCETMIIKGRPYRLSILFPPRGVVLVNVSNSDEIEK